MLSQIPEALAAFDNLRTIVKAMMDAKTNAALMEQAVKLNFAIMDAQNAVIAIQSQYQSLLEEKDALKKQLVQMKNWEAESAKYEPVEMIPGIIVYALKADYKSTAPPHWLCPNCYQNAEKFFLQHRYNRVHHKYSFNCQKCGLELIDTTNGAMPS
jgi:hypothetical protein